VSGLARRKGLARGAGLQRGGQLQRSAGLQRSGPINPVSDNRQAGNRERAKMAGRLWPNRRDGTVMCGCGRPECHRRADDLHEPKFRSRLGSPADPENVIPVSRECHDWIHTHEQEAHELGLAVHSWE
jgi:hypothetical protein